MSDQLFIVLRVCLLALVYLVFLRVLRAVWVELRAESVGDAAASPRSATARAARPSPVGAAARPQAGAPAPAMAPAAPSRSASRLVMIAPPSLAGHSFVVDGETTIGRGAGCAVAIDDSRVSKLHARVYPHDGSWLLEDLGSTNGTMLDGKPVTGPTPITVGGRISIGEIVLELA